MDAYRIVSLGEEHDRTAFTCGVEALDRYFHTQVTQDMRRRVTACYIAVDETVSKIAGFYRLAASGVLLADLPPPITKRLPRYPSVPVARLGRLAVDQAYRGQKLGGALLWDSIARAMRSEVAVFGMIVDAKDEQAEAFYLHYGFVPISNQPQQLVLPFSKIKNKV